MPSSKPSSIRPAGALPQPVLSPPAPVAVFLVVTIEPGGESAVREVLSGLAGLVRAVGFPSPDGGLCCVAGVGSTAWDRLFEGPRPGRLHPFEELEGPRHRAVATPGDLLFHIRAARTDLCFALSAEIMKRLRGAVTVQDEVLAFAYFDSRNLLGFVDGTENPVGPAAAEAAIVGDEDPAFLGGSYAIVQKYVHDVDAWEALAVEAQEKVIGRSKLTNIELDMPGSHIRTFRRPCSAGCSSAVPNPARTRSSTTPRRSPGPCSSARRPASWKRSRKRPTRTDRPGRPGRDQDCPASRSAFRFLIRAVSLRTSA